MSYGLKPLAGLLACLSAGVLTGCVQIGTADSRYQGAAPLAHGPVRNDAPHGMPGNSLPVHNLSEERLAVLDRVMKEYVASGKLAGAVVMIHQDGREVFSNAYGWRDREAGDAMEEDDIFRIASQTKALTSIAVMMLMEEGKLLLEDPLGKFMPEWSKTTVAVARDGGGYDVAPARRAITIRDLLSHSAGISYGSSPGEKAWRDAGIFGWYFADRNETVADVVKRMPALPMAAQPGEAWVYGYNTDILGALVETLSGLSLDVFFKQRLLDPLGMKDTSFCLPPEKSSRLAVVYSAKDGRTERAPAPGSWTGAGHIGQGHYENGPCKAFAGGAGLLSTAKDYSRFLEMLRRGGELDGRRYLSRKSVEQMSQNALVSAPYQPGQSFGLGFRITEAPGKMGNLGSIGDYGWGGAYHSTYWIDPAEGLTVTFMTQLIPSGGLDTQAKLRALIYAALE